MNTSTIMNTFKVFNKLLSKTSCLHGEQDLQIARTLPCAFLPKAAVSPTANVAAAATAADAAIATGSCAEAWVKNQHAGKTWCQCHQLAATYLPE
jgi:hypothetical protein